MAEPEKALAASNDHPMVLAVLGHVYGRAGRAAEARRVEERLREQARTRYVAPYYCAVFHAGTGDRDAAIRELEKVYADRHVGILSLATEAEFRPLRPDPRFQELLRQVGLPAPRE